MFFLKWIVVNLSGVDNMKKSTLIGLSILSVFMLCSLSYNPIIADETIQTNQLKQSLKDEVLRIKTIEEEDCGCGDTTEWNYPVLCTFLYGIYIIVFFSYAIFRFVNFFILFNKSIYYPENFIY